MYVPARIPIKIQTERNRRFIPPPVKHEGLRAYRRTAVDEDPVPPGSVLAAPEPAAN
jgi:hypothetical protein